MSHHVHKCPSGAWPLFGDGSAPFSQWSNIMRLVGCHLVLYAPSSSIIIWRLKLRSIFYSMVHYTVLLGNKCLTLWVEIMHMFSCLLTVKNLKSSTDESINNCVAKFVFLFMNLKEKHHVWLPLLTVFFSCQCILKQFRFKMLM